MFIIWDIRNFVSGTGRICAYFKIDTVKEDNVILGRVHGYPGDTPAYIGFKAGVEVMVKLPSVPAEITTNVYEVIF